ncbi:MAG: hypothetical protein ACK5OA_15000, partial [Acidovorax sp.]
DLGPIPNAYGIAARLAVSLPGMDKATAQKLVDAAHQVCPYSNATRGNIDVTLTLGSALAGLLARALWRLPPGCKPAFRHREDDDWQKAPP